MLKHLLLLTLLSSCVADKKIDRRIYQPSYLFFAPATKVETTEGIYITGDTFERWYSAKVFDELEEKLSQF